MSIRPQGRPKNRWEDDIRNDRKKLKKKNWTSCIQDRNKWKSYVNNIYLLQLGCHPVAVVILHVNKTRNWLLLNLRLEGYMRSM